MRTRSFRVAYSFKHAQFVVQRGAVVIVPTRAHSACMICGGARAEPHSGHTFTPDDARERAPKLAAALNRLYNARPHCAEWYKPEPDGYPYAELGAHFEDGSPKYGWGAP